VVVFFGFELERKQQAMDVEEMREKQRKCGINSLHVAKAKYLTQLIESRVQIL
jgi:hypothetical protein